MTTVGEARRDATLTTLAAEFWRWRTSTQPDSYDDIPRVPRPPGWLPDWSAAAVDRRRRALREFGARHRRLDLTGAPVAVQVDGRLLGSALARVQWELELLQGWRRDPCFYVDQSLVPVYHLLLPPPPFDEVRAAEIVRLLDHVPRTLRSAERNLAGHAAPAFTQAALHLLEDAGRRVGEAAAALGPELPGGYTAPLRTAAEGARRALDRYQEWLSRQRLEHGDETSLGIAVGADALRFFLHRVALLPYPVDRLRELAKLEYDRATAAEAQVRARGHTGHESPLLPSAAAQIARQRDDEREVRGFLSRTGLLELPAGLRHYRNAPMPDYLEPLSGLGVPHHTGTAPGEDALRYIREPHSALPYFQLAEARDPRLGVAHEGVHAWQLALAHQHTDPLRRHYYDSVPHEGTAFYTEELLLTAGLFDDSPDSVLFLYGAMRLRALRVEVDTGLALGLCSVEQAADRLARAVPMDRRTAWEEAVFFAGRPGQGLSYQVGKTQIRELLSACAERQGPGFSLPDFHRRLWHESAVPFALQRWELLGLRDQVDEAERLAGGEGPGG
ncbi:DUF885 family protein [Streptomyces sp. NPDC050759]|uniref:DUF885 family protein n=1 Tax=Streptomyces sp. NPDC050759 TaxID=3365635 RepID=UPI0037B00967